MAETSKSKKTSNSKKAKPAETKTTESQPEDSLITAASKRKTPKTQREVIGQTKNGAIGVESVSIKPKKVASSEGKSVAKKKKETVAIYSNRNVSWSAVGKVYRGYNIVTQEQADKWLTRSHCRLATPEEVAQEFGKG